MSVRPRGDGFQADFTFPDKGRFRAQFPTRQGALQWEADMRAALLSGRPLPAAPTGANADTTLGGLQKATFTAFWKGTKNERGAGRNSMDAVELWRDNQDESGASIKMRRSGRLADDCRWARALQAD